MRVDIELDQIMKKRVEDYKETDNFSEYQKIYQEYGTSLEDVRIQLTK